MKVKVFIGGLLLWLSGGRLRTCAAKKEIWRRRSERLQAELNRDHSERLGWYVENHEYRRTNDEN